MSLTINCLFEIWFMARTHWQCFFPWVWSLLTLLFRGLHHDIEEANQFIEIFIVLKYIFFAFLIPFLEVLYNFKHYTVESCYVKLGLLKISVKAKFFWSPFLNLVYFKLICVEILVYFSVSNIHVQIHSNYVHYFETVN